MNIDRNDLLNKNTIEQYINLLSVKYNVPLTVVNIENDKYAVVVGDIYVDDPQMIAVSIGDSNSECNSCGQLESAVLSIKNGVTHDVDLTANAIDVSNEFQNVNDLVNTLNNSNDYSNLEFSYNEINGEEYEIIVKKGDNSYVIKCNSLTGMSEIKSSIDNIVNDKYRDNKEIDLASATKYVNGFDEIQEQRKKDLKSTYGNEANTNRKFVVDVDSDMLLSIMTSLDRIGGDLAYGYADLNLANAFSEEKLREYYNSIKNQYEVEEKTKTISDEAALLYSKIDAVMHLYHDTDVNIDEGQLKAMLDEDNPVDVNNYYSYYKNGYDDFLSYEEFCGIKDYFYPYLNDVINTMTQYEKEATMELLDQTIHLAYSRWSLNVATSEDDVDFLHDNWDTFKNAFGKKMYERICNNNLPVGGSTVAKKEKYFYTLSENELNSLKDSNGKLDYYQATLNLLSKQEYPMSYIFQPIRYSEVDGSLHAQYGEGSDQSYIITDLFIECMDSGLISLDKKRNNDENKWQFTQKFRYQLSGHRNIMNSDNPTLEEFCISLDGNAQDGLEGIDYISSSSLELPNIYGLQGGESLEELLFGDKYLEPSILKYYNDKYNNEEYIKNHPSDLVIQDLQFDSLDELYKFWYNCSSPDIENHASSFDSGVLEQYMNNEDAHAILIRQANLDKLSDLNQDELKKAIDYLRDLHNKYYHCDDSDIYGRFGLNYKTKNGIEINNNYFTWSNNHQKYIDKAYEILVPLYDKYFNPDSEIYIESPIKNEYIDWDIIEDPSIYLARNSGVLCNYAMWEQAQLKKLKGEEKNTGASFWSYVRNLPIALGRGAVQFFDDIFDATLYTGALTYQMTNMFTSPRGRKLHTRDKTLDTLMFLSACDPVPDALESLYAETNAPGMDLFTSVFESVGYYGTSFYFGAKLSNSYANSFIAENPNAHIDPKLLFRYVLNDNLPGGIAAAGKRYGDVSKLGLDQGNTKAYYDATLIEPGYAALSYITQYSSAKLISNSASFSSVKYVGNNLGEFSVVDNKIIGYLAGYGIKMSAPAANEIVYSALENRPYDMTAVGKETLEAGVSQSMSIVIDNAGNWIKNIKSFLKNKFEKITNRKGEGTKVSSSNNSTATSENTINEVNVPSAQELRLKGPNVTDNNISADYNKAVEKYYLHSSEFLKEMGGRVIINGASKSAGELAEQLIEK